jgi:hypothetical protein
MDERLLRDAISARAYVEHERGEWVVYVEVLFLTEIVKRRIRAYGSKHQAELAARWMGWNANRDLTTPPAGSP